MMQRLYTYFRLFAMMILVMGFAAKSLHASEPISDSTHGHDKAKFAPGEFIMHHIADAHDWHIVTIGDHHISLPLPVILYTKEEGLTTFMSSRFKAPEGQEHDTHANKEYEGFVMDAANHITHKEGYSVYDFSMTKNVMAMLFSMVLLCWIFISLSRKYQKNPNKAPSGFQSMIEPLLVFLRDDVIKPSIGEKKMDRYTPFLMTVFFFIFINNLLGLVPFLPGGANVTGNIAITLVLALFTFIITNVSGNKAYWQHIVNAPGVPWWLKIPLPLMPIVELVGVFTKPFVLMVRLFANISAGHIIALGFFSLIFIFGEIAPAIGYGVSIVSILFTVFMTILELLVAFIQAYVFTLLSSIYIGMATEEHH